ncbi:TIGR04222 domain-containing membrane protein [Asanoa siamensis]|uniref:TIGR04222 domain-containing protein n=1 Tax=Asanoa siamensis TaxID=926357 RepID=A0ABQ4D1Y4_9ACTN|nr:TIGR04222 domain-containing membrane protein [Asanoa siamensis]GIF77538.1 hypothetical protein Asi02nite_70560 [Asanoa siamensis]
MTLAASVQGIPLPAFVAGYLLLSVAAVVATARARAVIARGRGGDHRLGPHQVAFLTGGPRLAVNASLAWLRRAGAIGVAPGGRIAAAGPLPAGATPLDGALHDAAGPGTRVRQLHVDPAVERALGGLRVALERDGLLLSRGRRWLHRAAALFLLPVVAVGGRRIAAGTRDDQPPDVLLLVLVVSTLCWLLVSLSRAPWRTAAGTAAVDRLLIRHQRLAPAQRPSYATHDAGTAAMGVALFGGPAMFRLDPAFAVATEAGVAQPYGGR